jgi:hypothetical protein
MLVAIGYGIALWSLLLGPAIVLWLKGRSDLALIGLCTLGLVWFAGLTPIAKARLMVGAALLWTRQARKGQRQTRLNEARGPHRERARRTMRRAQTHIGRASVERPEVCATATIASKSQARPGRVLLTGDCASACVRSPRLLLSREGEAISRRPQEDGRAAHKRKRQISVAT